MIDFALAASSLGASVAAGMFLAAGLNIRQRNVSKEAEPAVQLMAVWWLGLAVFAVAGASTDLTIALGARPFTVLLAFHYARIAALCIGLWGLMFYTAYVFTGNRRLLAPLAGFFALYYAALVFFLTLGQPYGIETAPWPRLALANPILDTVSVGVLVVIPPLVAALVYLCLYRKASDSSQRVRILFVTVGTIAWFGGSLAREANAGELWIPLAMGLLAAWAVQWAYAPPRWLGAPAPAVDPAAHR